MGERVLKARLEPIEKCRNRLSPEGAILQNVASEHYDVLSGLNVLLHLSMGSGRAFSTPSPIADSFCRGAAFIHPSVKNVIQKALPRQRYVDKASCLSTFFA
jgi:hypothetical protein